MEQQEKYSHYIGTVIDERYKVEKIKGIGGMAVVFKAYDLMKKRTVAIKMLDDKYSGDTQAVRRFVNESKAVALLSNEHIVDIFDVCLVGHRKYIVMEFIDGITLKEYLKRNAPISIDQTLDFTMQILSALRHAHEKGVVHRDIKPQNIMVQSNGKLKVTDFGIAQIQTSNIPKKQGVAMGTVYYISPEQASGMESTSSSDIYSLGVMLYEMASGRLPFDGDTALAIAMMQVNNSPLAPRKINPKIPIGLEQIILKAMSKKPEDRFRSAASMLRACDIIKKDKTIVFDTSPKSPKKPQKEEADNNSNIAPAPKLPAAPANKIKSKKGGVIKSVFDKKESAAMFPIILGVVSAFVLVALVSGVLILMSLLNMTSEDSSMLIEIPALIGTQYSENLDSALASQNIALEVIKRNDQNIPEGQIVNQIPNAGEKRKISDASGKIPLKITVSLGKTSLTLENFANKEYRNVKMSLENQGIFTNIEEKFDNAVISGYVISTEPGEGSQVYTGDTVKIIVSKGKEPITSPMINVVNLPAAEAKKRLLEANFTVGTIKKQVSDTVPEGYVISQSIAPNTKTEQKSTPVNLVISIGRY